MAISICCPGVLFGLDGTKPMELYRRVEWTVANGLPSDTVRSISGDNRGFLWVSTNRGVMRFDGVKWENVADFKPRWIPGGVCIRAHWQNPNRQKWVLTCDGYLNRVRYHGVEPLSNISHLGDRWLGGITSVIRDKNGTVWLGGNMGLLRFRKGRWEPFELDDDGNNEKKQVNALCVDNKNTIWAGTGRGLWKIKGGRVSLISERPVRCLVPGADNTLWCGTAKGISRVLPNRGGKTIIQNSPDTFAVNHLFIDDEGSLWIGTDGSGLIQWRDTPFTTYSRESGLSGGILSLYYDRSGRMWAGTANDGLYYLENQAHPHRFKKFMPQYTALSTGITAITEDRGGFLWLGTSGNGLFRIKDNRVGQFTAKNTPGLLSNTIWVLMVHSHTGVLWIGTPGGLNGFHRGKIAAFTAPRQLVDNRVVGIYQDTYSQLVVTTFKGIDVFRGGGMANEHLGAVFRGRQVSCFQQEFQVAPGSSNEKIPGPSWAVTSGNRLNRIRGNETDFYIMDHPRGITMISAILDDEHGYSWLNTNKGILRLNRAELHKALDSKEPPMDKKIYIMPFGLADGLKSLECSFMAGHSAVKTPDGRLWFATKKGVSVIHPARVTVPARPPAVIIHSVTSGNNPVQPGMSIVPHGKETTVRFRFTAPTFIAPRQLRFKYKLGGFDKEWRTVEPGKERTAVYRLAQLKPGAANFQVMAADHYGRWGDPDDAAAFTFVVERRFKDYYFEILLIALGLSIVAIILFITWKTRRRKRLNKRIANGHQKQTDTRHETQTPTVSTPNNDKTVKKLVYLLEVEKIYRDENLTVKSAAEKLSVQPYRLSQVVNENLGKTFPDLVNGYRIDEIKSRLTDPAHQNATILEIAINAGFSSKGVFNKTFKKYTGMTPTAYRRQGVL